MKYVIELEDAKPAILSLQFTKNRAAARYCRRKPRLVSGRWATDLWRYRELRETSSDTTAGEMLPSFWRRFFAVLASRL